MILSLPEVARLTNSPSTPPETPVSDYSIDTRSLSPGALYFALKGENTDGHQFLANAASQGAAAAVVDHRELPAAPLPLIRVDDPLTALQDLARQARPKLKFPLIAVTGSAGKTTTKESLSTLLGATRNEGNLNNHIGLPLSLLRLSEDARAGVLEMGMNHAGEIRFLARIARPDVGVITNVGTAHIENFPDIHGIALAKRELIEELGPAGTAILNNDDPLVRDFAKIHPGRTITYDIEPGADVRAANLHLHEDGANFTVNGTNFEIELTGRHGVLNVLAAVAAGLALHIPLDTLAARARTLKAGKMRGERIVHNGVTLLNDCYNSNPEAAKAMLDTLAALPGNRKIAVLGEMLELGAYSEKLHHDVGAHAAANKIDIVLAVKGAARHLAAAAQAGTQAFFFDDPVAAGDALRSLALPGDVVLLKGSRGTRVEKALERFMAA